MNKLNTQWILLSRSWWNCCVRKRFRVISQFTTHVFSRRSTLNQRSIIIGENTDRRPYCWIPIGTHAEVSAINKMRQEFKKRKRFDTSCLAVIRISKNGKLGYARPCYHCIKQLQQVRFMNIKEIYYSCSDGSIVREKFDGMLASHKTYISCGYRYRNRSC